MENKKISKKANREVEQEKEFLEGYDSSLYEKPSVTVDLLIFTIEDDDLKVVMVKRKHAPFQGSLSLPGTFVGMDETLEEAAGRAVKDKTGLGDIYFEQLYTWGDVNRDPRMRIISVSYMALVSIERLGILTGKKPQQRELVSVEQLLQSEEKIAFDHRKMIAYGRERIKNKVEYTEVAFELVPERFTLPQLQRVYEILLNKDLYKANFRKKIAELVIETDKYTVGEAHRPSKLYVRRRKDANMEN